MPSLFALPFAMAFCFKTGAKIEAKCCPKSLEAASVSASAFDVVFSMLLDAIFNAFATLLKPTSNAILTQLATYAKSIFEQHSQRFACFYLPRPFMQHDFLTNNSSTNEVPYGRPFCIDF